MRDEVHCSKRNMIRRESPIGEWTRKTHMSKNDIKKEGKCRTKHRKILGASKITSCLITGKPLNCTKWTLTVYIIVAQSHNRNIGMPCVDPSAASGGWWHFWRDARGARRMAMISRIRKWVPSFEEEGSYGVEVAHKCASEWVARGNTEIALGPVDREVDSTCRI